MSVFSAPGEDGDLHILENAQPVEDVDHLVGPADAFAADLVGRQPGDVLSLEEDAARIGGELAGDQVKEGGLAGTVGADDGHDLPVSDREGGSGHGHEPVERFLQFIDAKHLTLLRNRSRG